jgi:hypothetical protein
MVSDRIINRAGGPPEDVFPGEIPQPLTHETADPVILEDIEILDPEAPEVLVEGEHDELLETSEPESDFGENLAEFLDEAFLDELGSEILDEMQSAEDSRKEWYGIFRDGLDLLGFKDEESTEPFPGSCKAVHPILAENIIKYQARARTHLLPPGGPVRTKVMGPETPDKDRRARRVREFMNFQIETEMEEYAPEHDRMLFHQAYYGSAVTKTYFDTRLGRPSTKFVKPQDFLTPYNTTSLQNADFHAEYLYMTGRELKGYVHTGIYRDADITPSRMKADEIQEKVDEFHGIHNAEDSSVYNIAEVHRYSSIPDDPLGSGEDGPEFPYVITIDRGSGTILSIRRNWDPNDPQARKLEWYVHWPFIPGFGFYGYGYVHIIGGLSKTASSSLRQLIDAGSFANLQGGFKSPGLRVLNSDQPLKPGEWREANAPGGDLSRALHPVPYKEPSQTLVHLMDFVVQSAQKFADSTEQVVSESTNYGPVGTTMALLEAGGRLFNSLHERLFRSQTRELRILARINAESLEHYPYETTLDQEQEQFEAQQQQGMQVSEEAPPIAADDFRGVEILPVTDPREPSEAHRIAKAQSVLQIAIQAPEQHNMPAVLQKMYAALGYDHPEQFLNQPQEAQPLDPISDIIAASQGQPIRAFPGQNHDAHIAVKMAWLEDEKNGSAEIMQSIAPIISANIKEHHVMRWQEQISGLVEQQGIDPQQADEETATRAMAEAAEEILRYNQNRAADEEAQDPMVELEEMRVRLQKMEMLMKHELELRKLQHQEDKLSSEEARHEDRLDNQLEIEKMRQRSNNNG